MTEAEVRLKIFEMFVYASPGENSFSHFLSIAKQSNEVADIVLRVHQLVASRILSQKIEESAQ